MVVARLDLIDSRHLVRHPRSDQSNFEVPARPWKSKSGLEF